MNKKTLLGIIEKYWLAGTVESVKWVVKNNQLKIGFVSKDRSVIGSLIADKFEMQDCEFGVYTTSELIKLLGPMDDDLKFTPQNIGDRISSMKFADNNFKSTYVLSDPNIIPPPAKIKQLPTFECSIKVDEKFTSSLLKSSGAMSDMASFAIQTMGNSATVTVGYSENNTNRISFKTDIECTKDMGPKLFSIDVLKSILVANKGATGIVIKIADAGLMKVQVVGEKYQVIYFVVELQGAN